jgi:hypothetical protein
MANTNEFLGFDLTQIKTLQNLGVGVTGEVDLQAQIDALTTYATNLNTWAVALATKLNADAGVTDVNYDTNPQA